MSLEPEVLSTPNTFSDIYNAVSELRPTLRSYSQEIEQTRRLPREVVELVRSAGVFRMGFEQEHGGPGLTAAQQTEVLAELSYADASIGWCAMVGIDSGLFANYLRDDAVSRMFPSLDVSAAGMLAPRGQAERVDDGFILSGRWTFGSGISHADWVFAGAHITENGEINRHSDGRPEWRVLMLRPEDVSLADNWYSTGLAGTSSMDFSVDQVFVPGYATFSFREPNAESGPLSTADLQMRKMPGVPLGVARAALDYFREIAAEKVNSATGRRWADDYRIQYSLGHCEMQYISMRHGVYSTLEERWNRLEAGAVLADLSPDERIATALARTNAFRTARDIVRRLYDLLASTSIYKPSPMDRWLRDLETMCQHFMAQDQIIQSAGAYLIGGRPENPLVLGIV
ncbi:acyl-CoA dehydrogenase family protein [Rhodococcus sp. LW-XY12]|uniref:acyl-CoA dehydrogenase family protein n=1 Tax=Rhodococcus sp. LW-XY12 TaxID=2856851 RepID=UPI001C599476|nr:acyl-CoA dehydrogenase family protein [Rhodococcus sp. LW-XY12]QXU56674.1 acyl-CoA dehydrogenase family protein [Rhodococcus sp. LW-XY12]